MWMNPISHCKKELVLDRLSEEHTLLLLPVHNNDSQGCVVKTALGDGEAIVDFT